MQVSLGVLGFGSSVRLLLYVAITHERRARVDQMDSDSKATRLHASELRDEGQEVQQEGSRHHPLARRADHVICVSLKVQSH